MTLREKQSAFAELVGRLILLASANGYQLTFGEAYRSPEEAARLAALGLGIKTSLHTSRLAVDFNLFVNGALQTDTESYRLLGEWWERQSTSGLACHWGGRFHDGGHFSVGHNGRK